MTQNNEKKVIQNTFVEILDEPQTVYNFEVEDWHTYFVSDIGVWVHNTCKLNLSGGSAFTSIALLAGAKWLGAGYYEASAGRYISADGARQFRITDSDLAGRKNNGIPHVHFESIVNGEIVENTHVNLEDEFKKLKK